MLVSGKLLSALAAAFVVLSAPALTAQSPGTETIVMVRHGEKPPGNARGQLDCQGLNRALALPAVLARYGKPAVIFAANPTKDPDSGDADPSGARHSYVRPLATIEPYAVAQGMPVNVEIPATDIKDLEKEVLKPEYANSLVVVAWEHIQARKFAEELLKTFGQKDIVPHWVNSDYETIYIFRVTTAADKKRTLSFSVAHEDLSAGLSQKCPFISEPKPVETPPAIVPAGLTPPADAKQSPK